jgi:hypothetical protein
LTTTNATISKSLCEVTPSALSETNSVEKNEAAPTAISATVTAINSSKAKTKTIK